MLYRKIGAGQTSTGSYTQLQILVINSTLVQGGRFSKSQLR